MQGRFSIDELECEWEKSSDYAVDVFFCINELEAGGRGGLVICPTIMSCLLCELAEGLVRANVLE